jgi:hypothetical protein
MKRRPDPDQALFRFLWSDPADDRPDRPADDIDELEDDDPGDLPPPLAARLAAIQHRELWGVQVTVRRHGAYGVTRL